MQLTTIYYSPKSERFILLFQYLDGILFTLDTDSARYTRPKEEIEKHIISHNYQLIGAFYENKRFDRPTAN